MQATPTTLLRLGRTDIQTAPLGVGVWAWGDRGYWNFGRGFGIDDVREAFVVSINAGITLFDTAEVYGNGASERILGDLVRKSRVEAQVATKFAPLPWRLHSNTLLRALDASLERLGLEYVDLYQIHWPYSFLSIEALMKALAAAVAAGKVRAVGVSNYNADQLRRAHAALAEYGVPLAVNQVRYNLLQRETETNGVRDACRELDVTLIAYSPLAQGLLTGKYTADNLPSGPRRFLGDFNAASLRRLTPLIAELRRVGDAHGGKTPGQVALNWLIAQGNVLPIPGAKNARQAADNAGALGWSLSRDEAAAITAASDEWQR